MSKKKVKPVHIVVLLDETGSMASIKDETISGFNKYVETIAAKPEFAKAKLTLTRFNTIAINTDVKAKALTDVPKLTNESYEPAASTNLYDAIGTTIKRLSDELSTKEGALMVIITDGQENSSSEYSKSGIRNLIQEKEAQGWAFVYLGMGFDAFAAGGAMGMSVGNTQKSATADSLGVSQMYGYASRASVNYAQGMNSKRLLADIDEE